VHDPDLNPPALLADHLHVLPGTSAERRERGGRTTDQGHA
jgi:hypothetical protein